MCKRISILIFSLWIFQTGFTQTPEIIFRHITRSSGLPVDRVTCLVQDSSGFIWIGSTDGLYRFDGFNYKAFYSSSGRNAILHSNHIKKLYVDSKGRLWIATYDMGLSMLEPGTNQMSQVCCMIGNSPQTKPIINDIKEDSRGYLWFATLNGLFRLSPDRKAWKHYNPDSMSGLTNKFLQITFDPSGLLLIGGHSELAIFDPIQEKFISVERGLKEVFKKRNYIRSLAYFQNKIWFSSWAPELGVYNVETKKLKIIYSAIGFKQVNYKKIALDFYPDSKGSLWIITDNGLHLATSKKDEITQSFFHQPGNNYSIISNKITSVLEDREGNIWIGTDEGISIGNPYKINVSNYSVNNLHKFPFGDKEVNEIVELDDHSFLIGTYGADGTYKTDQQFKTQRHFFYKNSDWDWVWKHYKDEKTKLVYISTQEGMLIYDQKLNTIRKSTNDFFASHYPVASFVPDSDEEIWVSCFRNLFYKYNLRTGEYKEYNISKLGEPPQVVFLSRDKENNLWILGHTSGLLKFDKQKEKIVERLIPDTSLNSLRQSGVYVFLDLGEAFLIGYDTHGISLYHKKEKKFEHFTRNEGLASNTVRDAFIAADKTVWIATSNGISHFDPESKSFINYNQLQGILQNNLNCIYPLSDGRIAAGSDKGIVVIDPQQLLLTLAPLAPVITEISVLDKKIFLNNTDEAISTLNLTYKENYFSIDFISPQYSNSNLVEYAYQLDGLQNDWVISGKRRFVSYANVPAGNYTFKIKCKLPGGQWIENVIPLSVKIQAAFYTRWWFFLFITIAVALVLYAMFQYRLKHLLRLERMRIAISSDLHDEVGSSLTSISIFSEMARKTASPLSEEDQYLQRIGDRSRESIDKMSDIIWSINPDNDSLEQILVRMKNYTSELADAKDIAIHWDENVDQLQTKLDMEHRKNIYLFYKEVVNNVIKHSEAKNIYIIIHSVKKGLTLCVNDDGKGFDTALITKGNGLKNIMRRSVLLKGILDINSGTNKGTSIQLFIPF